MNPFHVFVRLPNGPLGERRYKDVLRTTSIHEARVVREALEKYGKRDIVIRNSACPPGTN